MSADNQDDQELEGGGEAQGPVAPGASAAQNVQENVERVKENVDKAEKTVDNVKNIGQSIQSIGNAIGNGVQAFIGAVTNPIFWVVLIVAIAMLFTFAATQVLGPNENIKGCESGGVVNTGPIEIDPKTGLAVKESAWAAIGSFLMSYNWPFLDNKPMTKEQAAGVIGNMMRESMLTPNLPQGGYSGPNSGWIRRDASNAEVMAAGKRGGRALGLIQWDGERRYNLAQFAESKGKNWYDFDLQMEFMAHELAGSEGKNLKAAFGRPGLTPQEYTTIWEDKYERAGVPAMPERHKHAMDFYENFNGGSASFSGDTGGSCLQDDGVAAGSVVEMAMKIAYPADQFDKSRVSDPDGCSVVPQPYVDAKKQANETSGGKDSFTYGGSCGQLYASCDRFVATVIRLTQDPNFPWGPVTAQRDYMKKNPSLWQPYHTRSERRPGDIWVTADGVATNHIVIYLGQVNGKESIADASNQRRVGAVHAFDYTEGLREKGSMNRPGMGFRFVGSGGGGSPSAAVQ